MISFLHWLFLTTAFVEVLVAGLVYMVFRRDGDKSARMWTAGCLLMATGMVMLTVRSHFPAVIAFGLVNFIMLYALALHGHSFWLLAKPENSLPRWPLLLTLGYGLLQWFLSSTSYRDLLSLVASLAWTGMHAYLFFKLRQASSRIRTPFFRVFLLLLVVGGMLWAARAVLVSQFGIALSTDPKAMNLVSLTLVHLVLIAQQIIYLVVRLTDEKEQKEIIDQLHSSLQTAWKERQTVMQARQEERLQLLRDLHDGFGSKLASLRLMAEKERVTHAQMAAYIKEIMADLHLFADTLSHDEITLEQALVDMRYRTERSHVDGALSLHWSLRLNNVPPLQGREALHILRVMQEALHNAMRHARPQNIWLSVAYNEARDCLITSIVDDGVGMPSEVRRGQGLNSMQQRAREIGARLTFQSNNPGTEVLLVLNSLKTRSASNSLEPAAPA